MVIVGTGTSGSKYLNTNWPIDEGLDAGTTKQEGTISNLIPEKSLVSEKEKVGLN